MCAHYESPLSKAVLHKHFGIELPSERAERDVWPGYKSTFIRRHPQFQANTNAGNNAGSEAGNNAGPVREALLGGFGLIPHWSKDEKIARHTYNARSETVAEKPSFRDAWRRAQHCIVPVQSFFEPDWRSGKAVPTRITLQSGEPMGLAGLWALWRSPAGEAVHSFTLLTVNADAHPFMRQFHKPLDEKRSVVILPPERYDDWLQASSHESAAFLQAWPAEALACEAPTSEFLGQGSLI